MLIANLYSKIPIIRKLTNMSSSTIINHIKGIFDEHGIPERLISDNGPQYSSEEFRVFCARYGFDHVTSSPLYPRSNGLIERTVQTVKKLFTEAKEGAVATLIWRSCLRTTPIVYHASTDDFTNLYTSQLLLCQVRLYISICKLVNVLAVKLKLGYVEFAMAGN